MLTKEKQISVFCSSDRLDFYKKNLMHRYDLQFHISESSLIGALSKEKLPNMLILDVTEGQTSVIQKIRPVLEGCSGLVVTQTDDLEFINFCFEMGASDIFIEPVAQNLFRAKVKRLLYPEFSGYKKSTLDKRFDDLGLTIKEVKILRSLLSSSTKRLHRRDLIKTIWGDVCVHQKTLDVHIYNLRRKLVDTEFDVISEGQGKFAVRVSYVGKVDGQPRV